MAKKILVIDDEKSVVDTLKIILADDGEVEVCTSVEEATRILDAVAPSIGIIIIDYQIGKDDGIAYYKNKVVPKFGKIPAILISAIKGQPRDEDEAKEIKSLFIRSFEKPFDALEMKMFVAQNL